MWWHCNMMTQCHANVPRHWPFVRGINQSPVVSIAKNQKCGALVFTLLLSWISCWKNKTIELAVIWDTLTLTSHEWDVIVTSHLHHGSQFIGNSTVCSTACAWSLTWTRTHYTHPVAYWYTRLYTWPCCWSCIVECCRPHESSDGWYTRISCGQVPLQDMKHITHIVSPAVMVAGSNFCGTPSGATSRSTSQQHAPREGGRVRSSLVGYQASDPETDSGQRHSCHKFPM